MSHRSHLATTALVAALVSPGFGFAQDQTAVPASPAPSDAQTIASDSQSGGDVISAISATPEQDQAVGQRFRVDLADLPEPYQGPPVANAPLRATEVPQELALPDGFTATLYAQGLEGVERQPPCPVPSAKLAAGFSRKPGVARVEAGASGAIVFLGG